MSRELVRSPQELRAGDRIELLTFDRQAHAVIDLLYYEGRWRGIVQALVGSKPLIGLNFKRLYIGYVCWIAARNFPYGLVFVRRRSREHVNQRAREEVR